MIQKFYRLHNFKDQETISWIESIPHYQIQVPSHLSFNTIKNAVPSMQVTVDIVLLQPFL